VHEFVSWAPLAAVVVLVINDHVLKAAMPGMLTGKLSDVAGLFYFPLLLTAGARLIAGAVRWLAGAAPGRRIPPLRRWHLTLAAVLTGAVFAAINTLPSAMAMWDATLSLFVPSRGTVDPTDLMALVMLPLAWLWGDRWVDGQG